MKTPSFIFSLFVLLCSTEIFIACRHEQIQQFNIDLTLSDGSKESHAMYAGSMLFVSDNVTHVIAKAIKGTENELELEVTRYTNTRDSLKGEHTIQKAGATTNRISKSKSALLDPGGMVQVTLQSMAMIDTGRRPNGACQGNCCEAKCFSTFCCSDPDECKNVPCDCKPPSNCPVPPTNPQASHFFDLFLSGKEMMVFKDK